jgi:hypothetical protein
LGDTPYPLNLFRSPVITLLAGTRALHRCAAGMHLW